MEELDIIKFNFSGFVLDICLNKWYYVFLKNSLNKITNFQVFINKNNIFIDSNFQIFVNKSKLSSRSCGIKIILLTLEFIFN